MDERRWMPDLTRLDHLGLIFMMGALERQVDTTADLDRYDWRMAYGAAADDQTVRQLSHALMVGAR